MYPSFSKQLSYAAATAFAVNAAVAVTEGANGVNQAANGGSLDAGDNSVRNGGGNVANGGNNNSGSNNNSSDADVLNGKLEEKQNSLLSNAANVLVQQHRLQESEQARAHSGAVGNEKATKSLSNSKRAIQNRNAQRAFRRRKEHYVRDLEMQAQRVKELETELLMVKSENMKLKDYILTLQSKLLDDVPPLESKK